jgi:hypothetical protein
MDLRKSLLVAAFVLSGLSVSAVAGAQVTAMPPAEPVAVELDTLSPSYRDVTNRTSIGVLVATAPAGVTGRDALRQTANFATLSGDTVPRRRAVAVSEWYSRRLTIHRYGSYAMLPLFVTQFVLGNKLLNQKEDLYAGVRTVPVDKNLRSTHQVVAGAVGTLFLLNTTTGVWNLIESRHTEEKRVLRTVHALTMLAADAGFAYTGYLGSRATDRGPPQARTHRNTALASFGVSTVGAAMMWIGNRE